MPDAIKNALRTTMIHLRQHLSLDYQTEVSSRICKRLMQTPLFKKSKHIAIYSPVKGEVQLDLLREDLTKQFYYPVIENSQLIFLPVGPDTEFVPNAYNIPEPLVSKNNQVTVQTLDLVIAPLVAFDLFGTRLGFGKGYYDKALACDKPKHFLGVAYDFQAQTWIERQAWDIPLNSVMTPTRWIVF